MIYIISGILGFIACCLFDLNKIHWNKRFLNLFFVLGSVLLIGSTLLCILQSNPAQVFHHITIRHLILIAGLAASCAAEIYALFFALPFTDTYTQSSTVSVVDHGWYRVCRHPGFWALSLVYLFLWLLFDNSLLLYTFIIYTFCNFLYIILQDVYIFPRYIRGYNDYKETVPFLIPTWDSIRYLFPKNNLD